MSIRIFDALRQAREDYRHAVSSAEAALERAKAQAAVAHRARVRRVLASMQPPPVVGVRLDPPQPAPPSFLRGDEHVASVSFRHGSVLRSDVPMEEYLQRMMAIARVRRRTRKTVSRVVAA